MHQGLRLDTPKAVKGNPQNGKLSRSSDGAATCWLRGEAELLASFL